LEQEGDSDEEALRDYCIAGVNAHYAARMETVGIETMRHLEKAVMLQVLDSYWKEHLASMDHLRQGIHLRGYANKNPMQEYKREAYELFVTMVGEMHREVTGILCRIQIRAEEAEQEVEALEEQRRQQVPMEYQHAAAMSPFEGGTARGDPGGEHGAANVQVTETTPGRPQAPARVGPKVGRNDPCPCGSGKKYKRCHGELG
jgi:preprotein translocase subunit SecA